MLPLTQEELLSEIEMLPIDLKREIVDRILTSITPINNDIDLLWTEEANERKRAIETNEISLISSSEVFQKITIKSANWDWVMNLPQRYIKLYKE
jgi:hypothetical protein